METQPLIFIRLKEELVSETRGFSKKSKILISKLQKYPDLLENYKKVKSNEDYFKVLSDYETRETAEK